MASHTLEHAAHHFLHSDLWEKLPADALFALRLPDGETGYCSILGGDDLPTTLMLYPGDEGLTSYFRLRTLPPDAPRFRVQEAMMRQDCLLCTTRAGSHHTVFSRRTPYRAPTEMTDAAAQGRLLAALEAANYLAGQADFVYEPMTMPMLTPQAGGYALTIEPFPEGSVMRMPSPELADDIAEILKRQPESPDLELLCELVISPQVEEGNPPYHPVGLILLVPDVGIVAMPVAKDFTEDYPELVGGLMQFIIEHGKPWRIRTQDDATYMLLMQSAQQIGLTLEIDRSLPEIDAVKAQFYENTPS